MKNNKLYKNNNANYGVYLGVRGNPCGQCSEQRNAKIDKL